MGREVLVYTNMLEPNDDSLKLKKPHLLLTNLASIIYIYIYIFIGTNCL